MATWHDKTYSATPDATKDFSPGNPVTAEDLWHLYENLLAFAEQASGSPPPPKSPFNCKIFYGNATFNVPLGVTRLFVELGADGGDGNDNGGGGGGGEYRYGDQTVTPGEALTIEFSSGTVSLKRGTTVLYQAIPGVASTGTGGGAGGTGGTGGAGRPGGPGRSQSVGGDGGRNNGNSGRGGGGGDGNPSTAQAGQQGQAKLSY